MAKVAVTFRIMPEDAEVDVAGMKGGLRKALGSAIKEVIERPVAFGLVSLEAILLLADSGGSLEAAEESIRAIQGVGTVEVQSVDLL